MLRSPLFVPDDGEAGMAVQEADEIVDASQLPPG